MLYSEEEYTSSEGEEVAESTQMVAQKEFIAAPARISQTVHIPKIGKIGEDDGQIQQTSGFDLICQKGSSMQDFESSSGRGQSNIPDFQSKPKPARGEPTTRGFNSMPMPVNRSANRGGRSAVVPAYVESDWIGKRAEPRGPEKSRWRGGRKRNGNAVIHTADGGQIYRPAGTRTTEILGGDALTPAVTRTIEILGGDAFTPPVTRTTEILAGDTSTPADISTTEILGSDAFTPVGNRTTEILGNDACSKKDDVPAPVWDITSPFCRRSGREDPGPSSILHHTRYPQASTSFNGWTSCSCN